VVRRAREDVLELRRRWLLHRRRRLVPRAAPLADVGVAAGAVATHAPRLLSATLLGEAVATAVEAAAASHVARPRLPAVHLRSSSQTSLTAVHYWWMSMMSSLLTRTRLRRPRTVRCAAWVVRRAQQSFKCCARRGGMRRAEPTICANGFSFERGMPWRIPASRSWRA